MRTGDRKLDEFLKRAPAWKRNLVRMSIAVLENREHFPEDLVTDHELTTVFNRFAFAKDKATGGTAQLAAAYRCMYAFLASKGRVDHDFDDPVFRSLSVWPAEYGDFVETYTTQAEKVGSP